MIAVGALLGVFALGAVVQSPLRRWIKSNLRERIPSTTRFDIASGQPVCLPAAEPIATYPVTVVEDEIRIGG